MYYIGLDVHKRTISYCVKDGSGAMHSEGTIPATRLDLDRWMKTLPQPWTAERIRKNLHPRSSEARQESFCPLEQRPIMEGTGLEIKGESLIDTSPERTNLKDT
jgi:hypothetical protein